MVNYLKISMIFAMHMTVLACSSWTLNISALSIPGNSEKDFDLTVQTSENPLEIKLIWSDETYFLKDGTEVSPSEYLIYRSSQDPWNGYELIDRVYAYSYTEEILEFINYVPFSGVYFYRVMFTYPYNDDEPDKLIHNLSQYVRVSL